MKPIVSTAIMEQWIMDLTDLSEFESSNNHYRYIFHVIDTFSKMAWALPLKNKEAQTIVKELELIILKEGAPKVISSDNGLEFKNDLMTKLLTEHHVKQYFGKAYYPQSQGQVERFNGTIKSKLYAYMNDQNTRHYLDVLPKLVSTYNNTIHSTTKQPPMLVHRGQARKLTTLQQSVHKALESKAKQMVEKSLHKASVHLPPLKVNDSVRISIRSLQRFRQHSAFIKRLRVNNWTETVYKVIEIRQDEKNNVRIRLEFPADDPDDRSYFRHELYKVESSNQINANVGQVLSAPEENKIDATHTSVRRAKPFTNYKLQRINILN